MKLEMAPIITPKRREIGYIIPISTEQYRITNCMIAPITENKT